MDPSVAALFHPVHGLSRGFEERLQTGVGGRALPSEILADILAEPPDPACVARGHPTESVIAYFRLNDFDLRGYAEDFKTHLFTALVFPVEELVDVIPWKAWVPLSEGWMPPCGSPEGCVRACRSVCTRVSLLSGAIEIATKAGAPPGIINKLYMHVDAMMPLLCRSRQYHAALTQKKRRRGRRRKSATGDGGDGGDGGDDDFDFDDIECDGDWLKAQCKRTPADLEWAFTADALPDMSQFLLLATRYNHGKSDSNKTLMQMDFPHLDEANIDIMTDLTKIFYKLLPHRCNNRQIDGLLAGLCAKHPEFVGCLCKIIVASLLGIYEKSATKMPIEGRVTIYTVFHTTMTQREVEAVFVEHNRYTLLAIFKEFFRNTCEDSLDFMPTLHETYNWPVYDAYVTRACESVRERTIHHLMHAEMPPRSLSAMIRPIDKKLVDLHNAYRKTQRCNLLDYNLWEIIRIFDHVNQQAYEAVHADDIPDGREYELANPNPELPPRQYATMKQAIAAWPWDAMIRMDWLVYFGVSAEDIAAMWGAVFSNEPALEALIGTLSKEATAVFYNFFKLSKRHRDYHELPGDAYMYYRHACVVHDYYGVNYGEPIPRVIGTVPICMNCGDKKCQPLFRKRVNNKHTKGVYVVRYTEEAVAVCAKKPLRGDWRIIHHKNKKRLAEQEQAAMGAAESAAAHGPVVPVAGPSRATFTDKSIMIMTPTTQQKKTAKHISRQHMLHNCAETVIDTMVILRRVATFMDGIYTGCFKCLHSVQLNDVMCPYQGMDILCVEHAVQAYEAEKPEMSCDIPSCTRKIKTLAESRELTVYDDMDDDDPAAHRIRTIRMCKVCSNVRWIRNTRHIPPLKTINRGIHEKWNGPIAHR